MAKKLLDDAAKLAVSNGPSDGRLAAIGLLGLGDAKTARTVFPALLDARQSTALQLSVLRAMSGFLDRSVANEILARWKAMSPSVRREAVEVLFSRPEGIEPLIGAIESHLLAPSEIDLARLRQLEKHSNPSFRTRAQKIMDSGAMPSRDRAQVFAEYRRLAQYHGKPGGGPCGLREDLRNLPSGRGAGN